MAIIDVKTIDFDRIGIEDIPNGPELAKIISDKEWKKAVSITSDDSDEHINALLVMTYPEKPPQICSKCHGEIKNQPSEQDFVCPYCGLKMKSDVNLAINILNAGLRSLVEKSD